MRSITWRLVLGFIAISVVTVGLLVLAARWTTGREFNRFMLDMNQANLVSALTYYYEEHQSWNGLQIDQLMISGRQPYRQMGRQQGQQPQFYAIVNANGVVVAGSGGYSVGQVLSQSDLKTGIPILVDNTTVGTLLLGNLKFVTDPREAIFLQRMNWILLLIAGGTTILALGLGIWLSRTLTRPIRELTAATHAVSSGKLGVVVPVRSHDELGDLAESFNRMNADLERSLTLRRQMTADIAHELRTPLSLILGHAEAVHDGVLPPSVKSFEIIREEALRLEHLIDDLRVLSLADAGELSLNIQPADLKKWLEDIYMSYSHQAKTKNVRLEMQIDPVLGEIEMDSARMTQVLANILDNALRYTPEAGYVQLSARAAGDSVELAVKDSGPGVEPADLERIFDRFYRTDPSRQREDGGSGLGLAIAKSLVEKHRGSIIASSVPGQGLRIEIRLPLKQPAGNMSKNT